MQAELILEDTQLVLTGFVEADPGEFALGQHEGFRLVQDDVSETFAVAIYVGRDDAHLNSPTESGRFDGSAR
jgi:hypothetical protein